MLPGSQTQTQSSQVQVQSIQRYNTLCKQAHRIPWTSRRGGLNAANGLVPNCVDLDLVQRLLSRY